MFKYSLWQKMILNASKMCRNPCIEGSHERNVDFCRVWGYFYVLSDVVVLEWHLVCSILKWCTLNECSLILTRLPFPFFLFDFESTVTCVDNFIYRFLPHVTKRPSFRNFVSFKTETLCAWISPQPSATLSWDDNLQD